MMAASASRRRRVPRPDGPSRSSNDAEDRCRRALAGDDRAQAAFLDEHPGPRRGLLLQPAQRGRRRPARPRAAPPADRPRPDGRRRVAPGRERPPPTRSNATSEPPSTRRSSGPSISTPSRQRRRRSVTGTPADSASQRGRALSESRSGRSRSTPGRPRDRDDVGRVSVVRERRRSLGGRSRDEGATVDGRRERDGARSQHDEAAAGRHPRRAPGAGARTVYRRPAPTRSGRSSRRPRGSRPGAARRGPPRAAETAASSGPAARAGLRVQDEHADVADGHAGRV